MPDHYRIGPASYPQVLELAVRWSDGRRIFVGTSQDQTTLLYRIEVAPEALDDDVIDALEALEAACVRAAQLAVKVS